MAAVHQFEPLYEEEEKPPARAFNAEAAAQSTAVAGLTLALRSLSQRALAALADLFMLVTVASAWWLWMVTPDPNSYQLIGLSVYAVFILLVNVIKRRK